MPKPMLEVAGKPLLGHIVDALAANEVRDIAIVTGYLAAHIDEWCASRMRAASGCPRLSTLHQAELNGTAGAMLLAKDFVRNEAAFVFGWGDILMDAENYARFIGAARSRIIRPDARRSIGSAIHGAAARCMSTPICGWSGWSRSPRRGPRPRNWNNAGFSPPHRCMFDYLAKLKPSPRGELELPQAIAMMIDGRVRGARGRRARILERCRNARKIWNRRGSCSSRPTRK